MLSVRRNPRSLRANRRGSVMLEFALVAPMLLSLILSGLEFSFVLSSYSAIQQGSDFAARSISVNTAAAGDVATLVKSKLPTWLAPYVTVTVTQSNILDEAQNIIQVTTSVPAAQATPIAIFSTAFPWTLSTRVIVGQERVYKD
jgi:Flp pilus assembly protein TadG